MNGKTLKLWQDEIGGMLPDMPKEDDPDDKGNPEGSVLLSVRARKKLTAVNRCFATYPGNVDFNVTSAVQSDYCHSD
jgi:hypothetical protein